MKKMRVFQSTGPESLFQEIAVSLSQKSVDETIHIESAQVFQKIDGFGGSFTDSSAYLVDEVLVAADRQQLMTNLFDLEKGIGLSVIRNPMGASDYARTVYSYDDQLAGQSDPELVDFSIDHDRESILPLTKWAQEINPNLKVFASPWSPPGWMKTSDTMQGGKLKPEYYHAYANYFVKYIQEYQAAGLEIAAVTPQNEALYMPLHYPSMEFLAEEEALFIRDYLKPAFIENNLSTKILAYDHNWDRIDYAFDVIDGSAGALDGIAWHWYGGSPISQSRIHQAFPNLETHFTEGSGGEWIPAFEPAFSNVMGTGIDVMRHYSKTFVLWNIALDEHNGPTVPGFGKSTCRGLVKINQETKELEYTLDYFALAHFSKFVKTGARRIGSTAHDVIKNVAFLNEDGTLVSVIFNDDAEPALFNLVVDNETIGAMTIPPKSALTIVLEKA